MIGQASAQFSMPQFCWVVASIHHNVLQLWLALCEFRHFPWACAVSPLMRTRTRTQERFGCMAKRRGHIPWRLLYNNYHWTSTSETVQWAMNREANIEKIQKLFGRALKCLPMLIGFCVCVLFSWLTSLWDFYLCWLNFCLCFVLSGHEWVVYLWWLHSPCVFLTQCFGRWSSSSEFNK